MFFKDSTSESEQDDDEEEDMTKLVESCDDAATTHLKSYENVINPLTPVGANNTSQQQKQQQHHLTTVNATNQFNSSSSASTSSSHSNHSGGGGGIGQTGVDNSSSSSSSVYKARQLTTNGPQDFLFISTTSNSTETPTNPAMTITTVLEDSSIASSSSNSNLVQTSRICSKSYTKIPEIVPTPVVVRSSGADSKPVGSSGQHRSNGANKQQAQPTQQQQKRNGSRNSSHRNSSSRSSSKQLMNSSNQQMEESSSNTISMSRSVIVDNTSGKNSSYSRINASSISRQNSK